MAEGRGRQGLTLVGTLFSLEDRSFTRKNGAQGNSVQALIMVEGSAYPVKIESTRAEQMAAMHRDLDGKKGEVVALPLRFITMQDGRAFLAYEDAA